jgi:hypothetical protein
MDNGRPHNLLLAQAIIKRGIKMSTEAKIAANRENARKSSGPRSESGKTKSRLNALKSGIHATIPVLPGEDADAYHAIVKSNLNHFAPIGPVENVLVGQITAEQWRLERIQKAEKALHARLIEGQIVKFLASLEGSERAYLKASYREELGEEFQQSRIEAENDTSLHLLMAKIAIDAGKPPRKKPPPWPEEEVKDLVEAKLGRLLEPNNTVLEVLVPATETAPQTYLVNERRVAMRAYLAYVGKLQELQEDRKTVTLSPQPTTAAEKHTIAKRSGRLPLGSGGPKPLGNC